MLLPTPPRADRTADYSLGLGSLVQIVWYFRHIEGSPLHTVTKARNSDVQISTCATLLPITKQAFSKWKNVILHYVCSYKLALILLDVNRFGISRFNTVKLKLINEFWNLQTALYKSFRDTQTCFQNRNGFLIFYVTMSEFDLYFS